MACPLKRLELRDSCAHDLRQRPTSLMYALGLRWGQCRSDGRVELIWLQELTPGTFTQISIWPRPPKLLSLNAKGLNIPEKRSQVLASMRSMRANIVFLQETHFCSKAVPKLTNNFFPYSYHATSPISKTKGVSILLYKNIPFHVTDTLINDQVRYIFLKGTLKDKPITLANIYSPNTSQVPFFRTIMQHLSTFQKGILILGGDFIVPLNPLLDTSSSTS